MDDKEKLKILRQLSRTDSEKASSALAREFSNARNLLAEATDYSVLKSTLDQIAVYQHRVHADVIPALSQFLGRLQSSTFVTSGPEYAWLNPKRMQVDLTTEVLELVENLRYFDTKRVVEILVNHSVAAEGDISSAALAGLKRCASYDLRIFYAGENRAGLGASPQLEIISYLESNCSRFVGEYTQAAQALCGELLSPSIEGTSWDYKSVSWSSGSIPVLDSTMEVRLRTISFLKSIYNSERPDSEKIEIIRTLLIASDVPRRSELDDKLKGVIESDTLNVLKWLLALVPDQSFPVLQKIEHDVYWRFYHGVSDSVRNACLAIRDGLYENPEYQIYRNLIGFESIFEDWEESLTKERDFSHIEQERKQRASAYVDEITDTSWAVWKERLFEYCKTESNDMATFPIFFGFLREFAERKPGFAFELVSNHLEAIKRFTIPIYRGLWRSPLKDDCRNLLLKRVRDGFELVATAKLFLQNENIDHELLEILFDKASTTEDEYVLSILLSVVADNYPANRDFLIERIFLPTLKRLEELQCESWVHAIWYVQEFKQLVSDLNKDQLRVLLSALAYVSRVEFQTEKILKPIAANFPGLVLDFFRKRIELGARNNDYDAIPFDFHGLREPLSAHAGLVVSIVRTWYEENDALFQFRGGRLIANIFPKMGEELEEELITLVRSGKPSDAKFTLSILRNYQGQPFLHPICREIVSIHFSVKDLMTDVCIVLASTGVVSGEYGMAEAYSRKAEEIEHWLKDEDENVREFARSHIYSLTKDAQLERERAEESIELRKHEYGIRDQNGDD